MTRFFGSKATTPRPKWYVHNALTMVPAVRVHSYSFYSTPTENQTRRWKIPFNTETIWNLHVPAATMVSHQPKTSTGSVTQVLLGAAGLGLQMHTLHSQLYMLQALLSCKLMEHLALYTLGLVSRNCGYLGHGPWIDELWLFTKKWFFSWLRHPAMLEIPQAFTSPPHHLLSNRWLVLQEYASGRAGSAHGS